MPWIWRRKLALRYPADEILRTLFAKIDGFLNSRSLIYASSDPEDFLAIPKEQFRNVLKMTKLFWDL
jgi:hypothetical protein